MKDEVYLSFFVVFAWEFQASQYYPEEIVSNAFLVRWNKENNDLTQKAKESWT